MLDTSDDAQPEWGQPPMGLRRPSVVDIKKPLLMIPGMVPDSFKVNVPTTEQSNMPSRPLQINAASHNCDYRTAPPDPLIPHDR
jgi:hypothetical protein